MEKFRTPEVNEVDIIKNFKRALDNLDALQDVLLKTDKDLANGMTNTLATLAGVYAVCASRKGK